MRRTPPAPTTHGGIRAHWRPIAALITACIGLATIAVQANATAQADFVDEPVISNLPVTTTMDWLPDGRALIGSKWGRITLANPGNGSKSNYMTLDVNSDGERGLLDILVHPNFSQNKYFYAYYSAPNSRLTIERFTFTGNGGADSAAGVVIWQNPGPNHDQFGEYHIGGSLNIGPDDKLYLSVGDGYDGNNAQDLTNVFGKILRINQDGSVPVSNPFHDGGGPNIDEIWAFGLRNPFRASFDDVTERFFIADVGGNVSNEAYEEVNIGLAGKNYGWALCQGPLGPGNIGPDCPSNVDIEPPLHYYAHDPNGVCCQNASVTGGEVMRSANLPTEMWGAYVYGDYAQRQLRYLTFNMDGSVASDQQLIDLDPQQPVWIGQGPDGHIYYLDFVYGGENSELRRVRYTGSTGNQPPTITVASATPTLGPAPLTVNFTGNATDPEGDTITYQWTFGDGTTGGARSPSHVYTGRGTYTARLSATANGDTTFSDPITIQVGSPPTVTITSPLPTDIFNAGETLDLRATATDDGPQNQLTFEWATLQAHDDHTHPRLQGLPGANQTYRIPTGGHDYTGDTSIIVIVTVTDGDGLQTQAEVEIEPNRRAIGVRSTDPAVSLFRIDGINQSLPFTIDTVTGFEHEIQALNQPCGSTNPRLWDSWSNGASQTFDYVVPAANQNLTAGYVHAYCGPPPPCNGQPATIVGTNRDDVLWGTNGPDVIVGLHGDDLIYGLGGDDIICSGTGNDQIFGGKGDNSIWSGVGNDKIRTANGRDIIYGGSGNDIIKTGPGYDELYGGPGHDFMIASLGNDVLRGGGGNDVMLAGTGDDLLWGGIGNDMLKAKEGNDYCNGGDGVDYAGAGCEQRVGFP